MNVAQGVADDGTSGSPEVTSAGSCGPEPAETLYAEVAPRYSRGSDPASLATRSSIRAVRLDADETASRAAPMSMTDVGSDRRAQ